MDVVGGRQSDYRGSSGFGALLLRYRRARGLTQEDLADRSGMSTRAVSNLERGHAGAAQRRSAVALADALGLTAERRNEFLAVAAAARQRSPRSGVLAGMRALPAGLSALPRVLADFIGRERELDRIRSWVEEASEAPSGLAISIVGLPGIGKTTLAVAAARQLACAFPDGCLALDLQGMDDHPLDVGIALDRMLRSLGLDTSQIPYSVVERSSLLRSLLHGRRVSVLLDDAANEAQVRPLLAVGRGCLTLVTGRRTLAGLEGVRWLRLAPLTTPEAVDLVTSIAGRGRVRAEPEAARELVALCGHLPLALRIAGNRLAQMPQWSLGSVTAQLRDEHMRLTALTAGDLQIRSALAVSYQRLSAPARALLCRLALVATDEFGAQLAEIVAGTDRAEAHWHLEELVDTTLVQPAASPGRYRFHDLIRIFAAERWETEGSPAERDRVKAAVRDQLPAIAAATSRPSPPATCHESAAADIPVGTQHPTG